jgi:hypothetical protein
MPTLFSLIVYQYITIYKYLQIENLFGSTYKITARGQAPRCYNTIFDSLGQV